MKRCNELTLSIVFDKTVHTVVANFLEPKESEMLTKS